MALAGVGAGINELTALAVTSELAPTRKRGKYVAILVFTIIPFCPSVLWAQLIASRHGWRYCGALCGAWAAFGFLMTLMFYFPPPRVNSQGLSRAEVIKQIDFVGGFLSVAGMLLFMAGLQWGGYQVSCAFHTLARKEQPSKIQDDVPDRRSHIDGNTVPMAISTCPRTAPYWGCTDRGILHLGMEVCQISHVPKPPEAEPSDSDPHTHHHLHLRCQLLFSPALLANPGFQRLRS